MIYIYIYKNIMIQINKEKKIDEYPMVSIIDYYKYPEIKIDE